MSRTTKKTKWHYGPNGWTGRKQNFRDNMRYKVKYRDYHKDSRGSHYQCWSIIRKLFADGKSLEYIRKRLVDRHRCSSYEANKLMRDFHAVRRWRDHNSFEADVSELVCISEEGYAISAATVDMEPAFVININLPIYYYYSCEVINNGAKAWMDNYWGGGPVVYSEGKVYKFVQDKTQGLAEDQEDGGVKDKKLQVWPNERMTSIIEKVVELHIDSGMEECRFEVKGWKGLHPTIEAAN